MRVIVRVIFRVILGARVRLRMIVIVIVIL